MRRAYGNQRGNVYLESVFVLPIFLIILILSLVFILVWVKKNEIESEMLGAFRLATLAEAGDCSQIARNALSEKIREQTTISYERTPPNNLQMDFLVNITPYFGRLGSVEKSFWGRIEGPNGCE